MAHRRGRDKCVRKRAKPFYKPLIYRGKSDRNDARSSVPSFRPYSGLEIDLDLALNAAAAGTWGSSGRQPPTVRPSILRDTSPHLSRRPCVMARPSHLTNNRQRAARHEPAEFIMVLRYPLAILSIAVGALFVPPASAANIAAGRQVYQNTCAMCHGADGKGTLPGMPNFHQTGGVLSLSDRVLFDRIEHGYKSSALVDLRHAHCPRAAPGRRTTHHNRITATAVLRCRWGPA